MAPFAAGPLAQALRGHALVVLSCHNVPEVLKSARRSLAGQLRRDRAAKAGSSLQAKSKRCNLL